MKLYEPVTVSELKNVARFSINCAQCDTLYYLELPYDGYLAWRYEGKLLQHALPNTPVADRELLLSQTCGPCYDALFTLTNFDDDEEEEG
ncbi:MAG: hypothetical protein LC687_05720 [Actinobacteria bacterium]|nr:hypothetical protein [Actinomycetota bacterium]